MASRSEGGGGDNNMVPIIAGGLVVGAGIMALLYKMYFMDGQPAKVVAAPPEPVEEVIEKPKKKKQETDGLDCGKTGSLRPCPGKKRVPDCDDE